MVVSLSFIYFKGRLSIYLLVIYLFILKVDLFIYLFVYIFMATLGLRCCVWAFSSCGERGVLLVAVCRLLIAVASLAAEHGL